jgi:hypothetical protein
MYRFVLHVEMDHRHGFASWDAIYNALSWAGNDPAGDDRSDGQG